MISKRIFIILFLIFSNPLYAFDANLINENKSYCNRWADRFLSIKDGQNYRENKISSAKFPIYVDLCLEHYEELRNMYKKKNQGGLKNTN